MVMLKECKNNECHKKNCNGYTGRNKENGKPRRRWMDEVEED
jgi:hypothetical protein